MINIFAPINMMGYGIHAQCMIKALIDKGCDVNLTKIGQSQIDPYFESYLQQAEKNINQFDAKGPSLFIFHDEYSNQSCGKPLSTFSIFETTLLKAQSKLMLNNGPTDIVLATTQRHKEILIENGITKPIEIIHEGVDETLYNTLPATPWLDTKKFTYLIVGKKEKRKYTNDVLLHFINSMKDKEVALIAHTFNPFVNRINDNPLLNLLCWSDINPIHYGFEYKGWNGKAHHFAKEKCDIYFTPPHIQVAEMARLYHSANVGIQLSRGEAWDLPLIEALACGLPCITTNTIGHSEYLVVAPEIQKELIIPCISKEVANDGIWFHGDVGEWDSIDFSIFNNMLEDTYKNQNKYFTKDENLSNNIINNFCWEKAVEEYLSVNRKYTN